MKTARSVAHEAGFDEDAGFVCGRVKHIIRCDDVTAVIRSAQIDAIKFAVALCDNWGGPINVRALLLARLRDIQAHDGKCGVNCPACHAAYTAFSSSQPAPVDVIRGSDGERRLANAIAALELVQEKTGEENTADFCARKLKEIKSPGEPKLAVGWDRAGYARPAFACARTGCTGDVCYYSRKRREAACEAHAVEAGVFATEAPPQVGAGETKGDRP